MHCARFISISHFGSTCIAEAITILHPKQKNVHGGSLKRYELI